jgi:hypothetical protein
LLSIRRFGPSSGKCGIGSPRDRIVKEQYRLLFCDKLRVTLRGQRVYLQIVLQIAKADEFRRQGWVYLISIFITLNKFAYVAI